MTRQSGAFVSVHEFLRLNDDTPQPSALARFFGVDHRARSAASAYAGALAEIAVADALDAIPDEWTVLRDIRTTASAQPIAYTLIGPAGVFVLEIHDHSSSDVWVGERSLVVDGAPGVHIIEAEQDADSLCRRLAEVTGLPVVVTPCLVIANAAGLTVRERPRRVEILVPSAVESFFAELPRLLAPAIVERHREAALDPSTWCSHASTPAGRADDAADRSEFGEVHHTISARYRRRLAWAAVGASVSSMVLIATTGGIIAHALGLLH